jgi:hypothetical protein
MGLIAGETIAFSLLFRRRVKPDEGRIAQVYCGFVVGLRFWVVADFLAEDDVAVFFLTVAFFLTAFFLAAGFVRVVVAAWVECFARALVGFLVAALAGELKANEATSATRSAVIVLRIISPPSVAITLTDLFGGFSSLLQSLCL